jgi:hypothetical protein
VSNAALAIDATTVDAASVCWELKSMVRLHSGQGWGAGPAL